MKSLKNRRAGWTVLLIVASVVVAATVFVATGSAGKSSLTYVNVGAAAFVLEDSTCGTVIITAPASKLNARLARPLQRDFTHDGYSGALVDSDGCVYVAHIDLPDGMRIGSITAYYNNDDADATFRFEASDDFGNHDNLVDDNLDGSAGEEGGAVCDGSNNCSAIWDLNQKISNTSTHYGIYLDATSTDGTGFILYRFKIKIKSP